MKSGDAVKEWLPFLNQGIIEEKKRKSKDEEKNSYKGNRTKSQMMKRNKRKLQRLFRRRNR